MTQTNTTERTTSQRATPWVLFVVAFLLAFVGIGAIASVVHGTVTGWLSPLWQNLTDTQVSLLTSMATIYAAALAATAAPLIFHGQLSNLERASEAAVSGLRGQFTTLAAEQEASSKKMLELVEQSKASLTLLQNYALHTMGFVEKFTDADVANAKHILLGFQESAAILCQNALANSNRWTSTKAQFDGKWPGYQPYIIKLSDLSIINDDQKAKLLEIAESRKYTRPNNPESIDVVKLNLLNKTMKELQASFAKGA